MECPICFHHYDDLRFDCNFCNQQICLTCFASLTKEECPFCRTPLYDSSSNFENVMSHSYPPTRLPVLFNDDLETSTSRILKRQLRREHKRQAHERQQQINAQLSRIHNRQQKKSRQERRNDLLFDFEP